MIQIGVKLFAGAREAAGCERVVVSVALPATIQDLRQQLAVEVPALQPLASKLLFAKGTAYVADATPLAAGDELAAFPPVSGG